MTHPGGSEAILKPPRDQSESPAHDSDGLPQSTPRLRATVDTPVVQPIEDLFRDTKARYEERSAQRNRTLQLIEEQGVLAANDPLLVAQRLDRLHADRQLVEQLAAMKRSFSPTGPGVAPHDFPRSLERVLGTNDLIGIRFLEQGMQAARAVARVQIRDADGRAAGYGSGFLVSPRLFLTNNHVLATAASAAASQA